MPEGTLTQTETPTLNTEFFFGDVVGQPSAFQLLLDLSNFLDGDIISVGPRYQVVSSGTKKYMGRGLIDYKFSLKKEFKAIDISDESGFWAPRILKLDYTGDFGIMWLATSTGDATGIKDIPWSHANVVTGE